MTHLKGLCHIRPKRIAVRVERIAQDILNDDGMGNPVGTAKVQDGDNRGAEPAIQSLNVAQAASVILYELQKTQPPR